MALLFSADYKNSTSATPARRTTRRPRRSIRVYDVIRTTRSWGEGREFRVDGLQVLGPHEGRRHFFRREEKSGMADGIRADTGRQHLGRMRWVGNGYDGVHVFDRTANASGVILLPEIPSNRPASAGPKRNRLIYDGEPVRCTRCTWRTQGAQTLT